MPCLDKIFFFKDGSDVNDKDIKNAEDDSVNRILQSLFGTVSLEVIRFKRHEGNASLVGLERRKSVDQHSFHDNTRTLSSEKISSKNPMPVSSDMPTAGHCSNRAEETVPFTDTTLSNTLEAKYQIIPRNPTLFSTNIQTSSQYDSSDANEGLVQDVILVQHGTNTAEERQLFTDTSSTDEPPDIEEGLKQVDDEAWVPHCSNTAEEPGLFEDRESIIVHREREMWDHERKLKQTNDQMNTEYQRTPQKRLVTKMPPKNIEDIEDFEEMLKLLRLLNIKIDNKKSFDIEEMRKKAKERIQEQSSGNGDYSNGTTGFSSISQARKEDVLKRNTLENFYYKAHACLKRMDNNVTSILNTYYKDHDIFTVLDEQRDGLKKEGYHLLVAGESSAGKSSLLNLILGEEILPHNLLNTTSTICEVKYGEKRKLVVHRKYDRDQKMKPPPRPFPLKTKEECGKSYHEQIDPYVHSDRTTQEEYKIDKVELFWPHEMLKEGVIIIDTPGLGESDDMDKILMNYLPNAFAFIYVIDISHAGGMQKNLKEKFMEIVKIIQSTEGASKESNSLAQCSLFVCNKWDLVKKHERDNVRNYVTKQLSECWGNAYLNDQIVYMSTTDAFEAQQYGGVTTQFRNLLQSIKQIILRAINIRLYNHWLWLDSVLYLIFKSTNFYKCQIQSSHKETCERMVSIETRIAKIEEKKQHVSEEMKARLKHQTQFLSSKLDEHIHSSEFQKKFCTWKGSSLPPKGTTWEITSSNMKKAIEYKFEELLIQWENENQIHSDIHRQLMNEFLKRLNLIEEELEAVENATTSGVERQIDYLNNTKAMSMSKPAKVFIGVTSFIWVPVGVAGLVIGMPVLGAMALKRKVSEKMNLEKYRKDPCDYLEKQSKEFLDTLTEEMVFTYAEKQMQKTHDILSKYADSIPTVIEANRRMVSQLYKETRNKDEVLQQYTPIEQESYAVRKNMTSFGIELCPATLNANDLEWNEDKDSCVGEGEFSLVFRGKLKNGGRILKQDPNLPLPVAVKVFKQPFDYRNKRSYLNEEMKIRQLDHKNVLKFYGAMKLNISNSSNEFQFVFVRPLCQENLRDIIFDKSRRRGKASNTDQAINTFLKRAMEIADGLNYIHTMGLVHRHLKLENILVNKNGPAMIADIGIVGQYLKTKKSIIYLAPEVLANLMTRRKEADIYSYGIMLWEMWYGTQAFTELMPLDIVTIQNNIAAGHRPVKKDMEVNLPRMQTIMKSCWRSLATERPQAVECLRAFEEILDSRNVTEDTSYVS